MGIKIGIKNRIVNAIPTPHSNGCTSLVPLFRLISGVLGSEISWSSQKVFIVSNLTLKCYKYGISFYFVDYLLRPGGINNSIWLLLNLIKIYAYIRLTLFS